MACTFMRSLHDSCRRMHRRRPVAFAVILALLVTACGRQQTSEQTSGMNPLFPAPLGTAWGFIDNRGKIIIAPRFEAAQPYSEGLAAADGPDGLLLGQKEPAGGFGFYDRSGNLVLGPYFLAFPFAQSRARVKKGAREGLDDWLMDTSGTFLPRKPLVLDGIRFSEGLIAVRQDRKLGYMDLEGNIAI